MFLPMGEQDGFNHGSMNKAEVFADSAGWWVQVVHAHRRHESTMDFVNGCLRRV